MKTLNEYINESLLDDENNLVNNDNVVIEDFLNKNYEIFSNRKNAYTINNNIVDIDGDIVIRNKNISSLTNGLFEFGNINGAFECPGCKKLKNLKGGPKSVGDMNCSWCELISLEGAPEEIDGKFDCSYNKKLKTLEGGPKKINGDFNCEECENLKSLKGCPEEVDGNFNCNNCDDLNSLGYLPKKVKGIFITSLSIDKKEIKKQTNAKRVIVQK